MEALIARMQELHSETQGENEIRCLVFSAVVGSVMLIGVTLFKTLFSIFNRRK